MPFWCDPQMLYERKWLVYSNFAMLLPIFYALLQTLKTVYAKITQSEPIALKRFMLAEIIFMTACMILSMLYHMCDGGDQCSQKCYFSYRMLQTLDFAGSYEMLSIVCIFVLLYDCSGWGMYALRVLCFLISSVINGFLAAKKVNQYFCVGIPAALYIILIGCKLLVYRQGFCLSHNDRERFITLSIKLFLFCASVGMAIAMFVTDSNTTFDEYYWRHSVWHITIMSCPVWIFSICL